MKHSYLATKASRRQTSTKMYLKYYALAFFLFCIVDSDNRYEWLLLSILCALLKCNTELFNIIQDQRYIFRTIIIFLFAMLLLKNYTLNSCYQSFILLLFLVINELMLYDKSLDNFFYSNFEGLIYGLVSCQFIPIIPRAWSHFNNTDTDNNSGTKNTSMENKL